jgi:hypothetical protein
MANQPSYETLSHNEHVIRTSILTELNRKAIFDALRAAEIDSVTVNFDGYSDSGQIEGIKATNGEVELELPHCFVPFYVDASSYNIELRTLTEAIESIVYDMVDTIQQGRENGDGAYGEVKFNVEDKTIIAEFNERYVECTYSEHRF